MWGRPAEKGWRDGSREGQGRPEADGQTGLDACTALSLSQLFRLD